MSPRRSASETKALKLGEYPTGIRPRELSDGSLRWDARWRDITGREHENTYATMEDAVEARGEALRSIRRGGIGDPSGGKVRLVDWANEYFNNRCREGRVSANTLTKERRHWMRSILPFLGQYRLVDLRPQVLNGWRNDLREGNAPPVIPARSEKKRAPKQPVPYRPHKPSYVNTSIDVLARCLDAAVLELRFVK
ncbi:MAG TPA: hypothetical protein VK816_04325 [Jatrophihabitantaceae bacterium]|jgi:hypothetical protein|nr:hypothetical protein [Jatrophihabitantaceae bacterium]